MTDENNQNEDFDVGGVSEPDPQDSYDGAVSEEAPAETHLGDISEEDIKEAKAQIEGERAQQSEEFDKQMEDSKKRKAKHDDNSSHKTPEEELESKINSMDSKLRRKLTHLMKAEKSRLEETQYTGIYGVLHSVGLYKAKPATPDKILDNVLKRLVISSEEITERKKESRDHFQKDLEGKRETYSSVKQDRNKDVDLHDGSTKRLTSLEEQLTETIKARDQHLVEKNKPDYDGEVDVLLQNELEEIDRLEGKIGKANESQEILSDHIEDYQHTLKRLEKKVGDSEGNYELAKDAHRKAKRRKEDIVDLRDNRQERQNLLDFYRDLVADAAVLGDIDVVINEGDELSEEIFKIYAKLAREESANEGNAKKFGEEYRLKREREKKESLAQAKADRYAVAR